MNNPIALMQAFRHPDQFLQQVANNNNFMKNPIAKNTFEMMQKGDNKGLEELARNLCKEQGVNPDEALKQIKSQFGM